MSYNAVRRNEIRNQNIRHVGELVKVYDPNKKTVILLPGGMGSQLERTVKPYKENNPAPFKKYETVWIDIGIHLPVENGFDLFGTFGIGEAASGFSDTVFLFAPIFRVD